ncbi:MAG: TolC family protein [Saprospiraceae bacterium]|nr:TolC family protein [Saprospiraceae bacterium]
MKHLYIIILLLTAPFLSIGQESMTLEKALSIGLENNYGIKIADMSIQIAENNNSWARAGKYPTIDLSGSFSNNLVNENNPASFLQGVYYSGGLGANVDANWVVYNGGRIRLNKDQLERSVDQQRLNKATDINQLFRTIYQQYYEVVFQQEQLEVLNQLLALSQDRLAYEETKRAFGSSNAYNLIQFETSVLADTNSIITQKQNVDVAKRTLYNTLDIAGYEDYIFEERLSITQEPIDAEKLKSLMSEENYTIKSLEMIAAINRLNTGIAKAATKPVVSINGGVGFTENGFKFFADDPNSGDPFPFVFGNRITGNINAVVSYNLFDGGVRKTDIQNAELQEQIDQLSIVEAKAELNNQLDILIGNYQNQLALLDIADRQVQLANSNLEITEERFKSGVLTSLDYRNVQNQYLNAAFGKVGAIYSLLVTKSEIDFLVGIFGE